MTKINVIEDCTHTTLPNIINPHESWSNLCILPKFIKLHQYIVNFIKNRQTSVIFYLPIYQRTPVRSLLVLKKRYFGIFCWQHIFGPKSFLAFIPSKLHFLSLKNYLQTFWTMIFLDQKLWVIIFWNQIFIEQFYHIFLWPNFLLASNFFDLHFSFFICIHFFRIIIIQPRLFWDQNYLYTILFLC